MVESVSGGHDAASPEIVDARGHRCPMPLLMAKRALNGVASGERVCVLSTDEGSLRDFEVFARQSGHRLLDVSDDGGEYRLLLEKN
jgi:tRNA 2-thiouridine synthesizing protein A